MLDFPANLRQIAEDFGEKPESAVMRTEMESGPPKQRKRSSRQMVSRNVSYIAMGDSEYIGWKEWFAQTGLGADWFRWLDPVDRQIKPARIVGGEYEAKVMTWATKAWRISFTIETWG